MQNMSSHELGEMTPKALKEYIKAYNLPFKTAIEKGDLVRIIFNTRPISNESESYYRRHKTKLPTVSNSSSTSSSNEEGGFSFTNMVQELFTAPNQDSDEQVRRQQQAREQEQLRQQQARHQEQLRQQQARQEQISQEQARQQQAMRRQREEYLRNRAAQSTPQPSPPASSQRASPLLSNENVLSIHDLIKAKIDPASLSVRTLKSILKANFVEQSHVIEKSELIRLVNRLVDQRKQEVEKDDSSSGNEDLLCRICFDHQQNCVFLDCGHMVTCMECAKKLIETKNECPICREPILKLVHVFRS